MTYSFPGCTVEVWEWISNFIPHFTGHVTVFPSWDLSQSMLVKGVPFLGAAKQGVKIIALVWNVRHFGSSAAYMPAKISEITRYLMASMFHEVWW